MTDRELLELAAKAVGMTEWEFTCIAPNRWRPWNPLENDDDTFRLAVKLGLSIHQLILTEEVAVDDHDTTFEIYEFYGTDPCAATRRAVTRAAAVVGKGMP